MGARESTVCKTSTLPVVLYLWPYLKRYVKYDHIPDHMITSFRKHNDLICMLLQSPFNIEHMLNNEAGH